MNRKEIVELIAIRDYVMNSLNNGAIDRATISELNGILILLDKKIVALLQGEEFKEYIGFKNVKKAINEVAQLTNIKSSFNRK